MTIVTNQHALAALATEAFHLEVHLGHQGAGRIEDLETALFSFGTDFFRNTVSTENNDRSTGNISQLINKNRAALTQLVDDKFIVHHLMAHINRRTKKIESTVDDINGTIDTSTKAPWVR